MTTLVMEHKTSSEDIGLGSMYWRKLTLDAQISNYLVGARALGHEPDGVLYDVLRKPALRPLEANSRRSAPESPEEYFERCLSAISERPDHYYQRGVVVRLESEEQDAAFDTWQTAEQIRLSRNTNRWPRNVDACSQYNQLCDYWSVCSGETTLADRSKYQPIGPHPELDTKHHLPLLTSSSARTYRSCARKYLYSYEMGIRAREQGGPRRFGRIIHSGLEAWLRGGMDLDAALAAMKEDSYTHESAKAEAMIRGYHARWSGEPLEVIAVESEFVTELRNPETGAASRTFARAGKLDALVRKEG
jgi:PD-(D/E)XK nuclease superfamily